MLAAFSTRRALGAVRTGLGYLSLVSSQLALRSPEGWGRPSQKRRIPQVWLKAFGCPRGSPRAGTVPLACHHLRLREVWGIPKLGMREGPQEPPFFFSR